MEMPHRCTSVRFSAHLSGPHFIEGKGDFAAGFGWFYYPPNSQLENSQNRTYIGLEDSIAFLKKFCEQEGPFDGLMGFSQGGIVASLLAHVMMKTVDDFPPVKFLIFCATCTASSQLWRSKYEGVKCCLPSLHIWGIRDTIVPNERSKGLLDFFESPEILEHQGSHVIPNKGPEKTVIRKFIENNRM
eukprot:TRINITY_DN1874_c0_g1_i5.p1 TRINITY_DN1874_c0_g1~~TRINITY_DN1874_c0_g1_i5.p1  ORF type:complete len:187 (-),score=26.08 TRINITY_DN1874_c0_g1_i5:54-614(-)